MRGVKLVKGCLAGRSPAVKQVEAPAEGGYGQSHHYLLDSSSTTCKRRRLCLGIRPNSSGEPRLKEDHEQSQHANKSTQSSTRKEARCVAPTCRSR